jgi:hypothetical protein
MLEVLSYLVTLCEGERCLPLVAIVDRDEHARDEPTGQARLEATLLALARVLRDNGAVGRLFLMNQQTGDLIATRRVWP